MSERVTDARLRELTAAMPDRMGGTLVDTLLLRELAAEILAARTDDARTLAAEAAARGAAFREREAANEAAMLRAQVDALTAEVARSAEAMRRQAAAVRTLDAGRAKFAAYEQRTLRSLAGVARAALLAELDEARRERDDWNARATALESERDALTARVVDAEGEAARRTTEVVAIGAALGREGATAGECVAAIGALRSASPQWVEWPTQPGWWWMYRRDAFEMVRVDDALDLHANDGWIFRGERADLMFVEPPVGEPVMP